MISDELLKKTLDSIQTPVTYNYFFQHIDSPAWLLPLKENGYFKNPFPAIRTDGYVQFPVWPESVYLLKVADRAPNEVLEILRALPDTDNERVMDDVAKILLKVSPSKAARFTDRLKQYINLPQYLMFHDTVSDLICKFAANNHVESALALSKEMLEILPDPEKEEKLKSDYVIIKPTTKLRDYDYESIVKKITKPLAQAAPSQTIDMYEELLHRSIDFELTFFKEDGEDVALKEKTDDFSFISRPNIAEDSEYGHDPDDALVTALRDTVLIMMRDDSFDELEKLAKLKQLAVNKYSIFRRIAEYGLRDYKEVEAYKVFYDSLMKDKKLKAILKGEREGLNKVTSGFVTEKPTKVLKGLSDDELIEKLKDYKDDSGWSFERDSVAKELSQLVKEDPRRFASIIDGIASTKNEYFNEAIRAFEDIVNVLDEPTIMAILVSLHNVFENGDTLEENERHEYFHWAKASAIRFVEKILGQNEDKTERISTSTIDTATSLILIFCRDKSNDDNDGSNFEPVDWSINSVRGQALHALAYLLSWLNRNNSDKKYYTPIFDELDWHLIVANDSELASRSVYGWRYEVFYGSNKEWALRNKDAIFSDDVLGQAAFNAYVMFSRVHPEALEILGDVFDRQIPRLSTPPKEDSKSRHDPLVNYAQHIALHYWYGDIDLGDDSLMQKFFNNADKKYLKEMANFVGFRLYKSKDSSIEDGQITKLKQLWEKVVTTTQIDASKVIALEEFGSWFASAAFEPEWSLRQLAYAATKAGNIHLDFAALEQLELMAPKYPLESLTVLSAMIDGTRERWSVSSWSDNATSIIKSAYSSNNTEAKKVAVSLANKLVAKGYTEYRNVTGKE